MITYAGSFNNTRLTIVMLWLRQIFGLSDRRRRYEREKAGSSKANGREPKTCFGQVFNFKFGCFTKCIEFMADTNTAESRLENSAQQKARAVPCDLVWLVR